MKRRTLGMIPSAPLLAPLAGLVLLAVSGCGSSTAVSGTATYEGAPINNGVITFHPADGVGPTAGAPIVEGRYHVDPITAGSKKVVIEGFEEFPFPQSSEDPGRRPDKPLRSNPNGSSAAVPSDAQGNRTTVEIQPGAQTLDFHLTAPG